MTEAHDYESVQNAACAQQAGDQAEPEPSDCAVLLGNGNFPADWRSVKLFDEWLVPVCSPALRGDKPWAAETLAAAELIHPSRDCRDWRRWLERVGLGEAVDWQKGTLFDTLELGISAAALGHGVSIGGLALVWPSHSAEHRVLTRMRDHLLAHLPDTQQQVVRLLD
ncbi:MAG: LysR substrate-binding domain-containing protein [Pseudomonas sp.]